MIQICLVQFRRPLPNYKCLYVGKSCLCKGHVCHPRLFLRSYIWTFFTKFGMPGCIWSVRLNILCGISLSVSSSAVFVHKVSSGWRVARCTDKIGFVRLSNMESVVPLLAVEAIYCFLCFSASLYLSLSCAQQWSDRFSCGCLSVCRIVLLSQVLYSACLARGKQLPFSENSEFILSRSQGVFSCCSVSVLVLLDVRDTDKLSIYSTLCFLVYRFHPRWTCRLPHCLSHFTERIGSES